MLRLLPPDAATLFFFIAFSYAIDAIIAMPLRFHTLLIALMPLAAIDTPLLIILFLP
jgi:hypothetical protein